MMYIVSIVNEKFKDDTPTIEIYRGNEWSAAVAAAENARAVVEWRGKWVKLDYDEGISWALIS